MITPDLNRNYTALKNDLLQSGFVVNVTKSSGPVTDLFSSQAFNGVYQCRFDDLETYSY
jgi:hypothetical protein